MKKFIPVGLILIAVTCVFAYFWSHRYPDQRACIEYKYIPISQVPARCFYYFNDVTIMN